MESIKCNCVIKLCDNDEKIHKQIAIELNEQILMTVKDLQKKLEERFFIEIDLQEIFHGEKRIDLQLELKLARIGKVEELTLKHGLLPNLDLFMQSIEEAKKSKNENFLRKVIKIAMPQLEKLEKTKFFVCYPKFGESVIEFNKKFAHYLDTDAQYLKCAVRTHFKQMFPDAEISFEQKTKGLPFGAICSVKEDGKPHEVYYMKSHYNIHKSSAKVHSKLDLRELFIYKLLAKIHVGPTVHFIRNIHNSQYGLFIATKAVNGFIEKSNPNFKGKPEFDLKLELLEHIFELGDLTSNSNNYGADEDGNLMIVDFWISNQTDGLKAQLNKNKSKFPDYSKILKSWNLKEAVITADDEIKKEKFNEQGARNKTTQKYNDYIDRINQNMNIAISSTNEELIPNPRKMKLQNPESD